MLSIRLQRVGRRNEPTFRVVLTDSKNGPKSGKFLEVLGSYDSRRGEKAEFDVEKVKYWMSKGAKLSGTMHNLLVSRKVIEGKKVNVLPRKKPIKKDEEGATPASSEQKVESQAPAPEPTTEQNAPANAPVEILVPTEAPNEAPGPTEAPQAVDVSVDATQTH